MNTDLIVCAHEVEGVGRVYLIDRGCDLFDVVRTDPAGTVGNVIDDLCIVGRVDATVAYLRALDDLYWLATPQARNADRDLTIDDAIARSRAAHPAGGGRRG